MKKILGFAICITLGLAIETSSNPVAGSCIPIAVPVKVDSINKTITHEGKVYTITVNTYRAETDVFAATWVEEGDPAYEIELQNKKKYTRCRIKSDLPFLSFDGNLIYQAKNGEVLIVEQGIASNYRAAIYETSTCKRIGYINDLYPEPTSADEISAAVRLGPNSSITVGIKTYQLGDKCIPVLVDGKKGGSADRKK